MSELKCPNCKNEYNSVDKYCPYCGKNLENVNSQIVANQLPPEKSTEVKEDLHGLDFYNKIKKDVIQKRERKDVQTLKDKQKQTLELIKRAHLIRLTFVILSLAGLAIGASLLILGYMFTVASGNFDTVLIIGICITILSALTTIFSLKSLHRIQDRDRREQAKTPKTSNLPDF